MRSCRIMLRAKKASGVVAQPVFDDVLLRGSDEELNEYIDQSGKCFVVDWRGEEGSIVKDLANILPETGLAHEWVAGKRDMDIIYRGKRHKAGLVWSGRDRYITLRRLNEVMAGDYEVRVFRHTYGDDHHCFYPAPCSWWAAMEAAFPTEIRRVFAQITSDMDFPDYRQ
jgi:hypothetical protein